MKRRRWSVPKVLLAVIGLATAFALFFPVMEPPRSLVTACLSNIKQLATAAHIYLADHDDRFPLENWSDAMMPYTKNEDMLTCTENSPGGYGYAMNFAVVGKVYGAPDMNMTVLFFETEARARNLVMNLAGRADAKHKERFSHVAYCDGSARKIEKGQQP